jgi:hypothetical protein
MQERLDWQGRTRDALMEGGMADGASQDVVGHLVRRDRCYLVPTTME